MKNKFILSINSPDYKLATIQSKLLANRLKGDKPDVAVIDFVKSNTQIIKLLKTLKDTESFDDLHKITSAIFLRYELDLRRAKSTVSDKEIIIFSNYYPLSVILGSLKIKDEVKNDEFIVWANELVASNPKLIDTNLDIFINFNESNNSYEQYLKHKSLKTQIIPSGDSMSVATLNNAIIKSINSSLSAASKIRTYNMKLIDSAKQILAQNYEQSIKEEPGSALNLKTPINLDLPAYVKSIDLQLSNPSVHLIDRAPLNELELCSPKLKSYKAKATNLRRLVKQNKVVKSSYFIKVVADANTANNFLGHKYISKNLNSASINPFILGYQDDEFVERYNRTIQAVFPHLTPELIAELVAGSVYVELSLKLNYLETKSFMKLLNKYEHMQDLKNIFAEQLYIAHPILFEK